jgi:hypothetical protein
VPARSTGSGFTLLWIGSCAPTGAALVATAAARAVPLEVVDIDPEAVGDAYDDVPLVLVRPDQHVAWRSRTESTDIEAAAILTQVTGADE